MQDDKVNNTEPDYEYINRIDPNGILYSSHWDSDYHLPSKITMRALAKEYWSTFKDASIFHCEWKESDTMNVLIELYSAWRLSEWREDDKSYKRILSCSVKDIIESILGIDDPDMAVKPTIIQVFVALSKIIGKPKNPYNFLTSPYHSEDVVITPEFILEAAMFKTTLGLLLLNDTVSKSHQPAKQVRLELAEKYLTKIMPELVRRHYKKEETNGTTHRS